MYAFFIWNVEENVRFGAIRTDLRELTICLQ